MRDAGVIGDRGGPACPRLALPGVPGPDACLAPAAHFVGVAAPAVLHVCEGASRLWGDRPVAMPDNAGTGMAPPGVLAKGGLAGLGAAGLNVLVSGGAQSGSIRALSVDPESLLVRVRAALVDDGRLEI
jgi:hypothetical protein